MTVKFCGVTMRQRADRVSQTTTAGNSRMAGASASTAAWGIRSRMAP
jgi:hypothetical protein